MTKIKKDYIKAFNYEPIKALKMNEKEKNKWKEFVWKIYEQDLLCKKLANDKCINDAFVHYTLIRDEKNQIIIKGRNCDKYKLNTNYLLRQFASNKLTLSLTDAKQQYPQNDPNELKLNNYYLNSIKNNQLVGLYLYGGVGIGKTFKTISYCNDMAIKNNRTISYVFLPELVRTMKENFSYDNLDNKKIINKCCQADILVLDDVGAEYTSSWFYYNVILIILNYRCENNKPIIVISNFSLNDLTKTLKRNMFKTNFQKTDANDQKIIIDRIIDRLGQLIKRKSITYSTTSRRK